METKTLTSLPVAQGDLERFREAKVKALIAEAAGKLEAQFKGLCEEFEAKFSSNNPWVYMEKKDVYYINDIAGVMPNLLAIDCNSQRGNQAFNTEFLRSLNFSDFNGDIPTEAEAKKIFNDKINYFRKNNGDVNTKGWQARHGTGLAVKKIITFVL